MESWRIFLCVIILIFILLYCFFGGKNYDNTGIQLLLRRYRDDESDVQSVCSVESEPMGQKALKLSWEATGHSGGKGSKTEGICRSILERHYNKKFPSMRLDILKNPDTGRNLELDCYCHDLRLALEYNGIQHYKYPNRYHKTEDDFIMQLARDEWKSRKCKEHGIYLIIVPYTVKVTELSSFIHQRLPKNSNCNCPR